MNDIIIALYFIMCLSYGIRRTLNKFDTGDSWGYSLLIYFIWFSLFAPFYEFSSIPFRLEHYSISELMNPSDDPNYEETNKNGRKEKTDEGV